jgi:hypothetical protein
MTTARASRSGVSDLALQRVGMGIRDVSGEPRLGRQSEALDRMGIEAFWIAESTAAIPPARAGRAPCALARAALAAPA